MKITAVKTSMLRVPNTPPVSTYYKENRYLVARIQTDEGIEGLGYTMLIGGAGADSVRAYMQHSLIPQLIGENPLHVNGLWEKMYDTDRGIRKKGIPVYAISALDIGLWDLLAKSMNRPVWHLLGACAEESPVYGSGGFLSYSVDDIVKEARGFIDRGCRHYKMKIGRPNLMENVERVRAVRKALGRDVELLVDTNQRWEVATHLKIGRHLEELDLFWYEEPVLADNIAQCAEVARGINIPIATGENEYTRYGFRDLIEHKAARYLNPDIHRCGGIGETMKIAHLAAAYNVKIAPHLVPELSIHILVSIPNGALVEVLAGSPDELWREPVEIRNGMMAAPTRPGHGMEFSEYALKHFTE